MLKRLVGGVTVDVSLLRTHRDFRLLSIGQLVSGFGNALTTVAVLYQVFALTHSSLAVGLIGLVEFMPLIVMAFVGGALADAIDRRRLVQLTELSLAGLSSVLAINALFGFKQVWLLFVVGALAAGVWSLQWPAVAALLPRLVEREELVGAVALTRLRQSLAQIGGPALAGVLIAAVGLPLTYTVDVATFVVSLIALRLMVAVPPPPDASAPSLRNVLEGLQYVRGHPVLLGTFLTDLVGTFFGWPTAVFPALAVLYTRSSGSMPAATALGFLYAAPGVGALLASLSSGWTRRVHHHGRGVILAVLVWGVAITCLGLSPTLWLAFLSLMLVGGANLISGIFRGALANETVPDALRGRLAGIELISYSSGPVLGDVETGAIATAFTPSIAVFSGGLLCLLGVGVVALAVPSLRRYDNRENQNKTGYTEITYDKPG